MIISIWGHVYLFFARYDPLPSYASPIDTETSDKFKIVSDVAGLLACRLDGEVKLRSFEYKALNIYVDSTRELSG